PRGRLPDAGGGSGDATRRAARRGRGGLARRLRQAARGATRRATGRAGMGIIEARGLARTFTSRKRTVEAVRGVDLTVREGEILGFLGPNGAGKTTTLRMLTTLLKPTGGAATVAGCDLATDPAGVRAAIGYVAQSGGVDPQITVREELVTQGRMYRLPRAEAAARAEDLARELDLTGFLDRKAGALSGGQRRRLDIAMALTHRPKVLF